MITQNRLMEILNYDPQTGVFTWASDRARLAKAGGVAGNITSHGYRRIAVDRKLHMAHRLAWLYQYGAWPLGEIDHIDHDRLNNKISNLRDVSKSGNQQNQIAARQDNKTGLLGASFNSRMGKYRAQIMILGKIKHLGFHPTAEAAHAAYLKAKRIHHATCTL